MDYAITHKSLLKKMTILDFMKALLNLSYLISDDSIFCQFDKQLTRTMG